MSMSWRVARSVVARALGAAPGLAWLAATGTAPGGVVALLGGFIGLGLSQPGVSAARVGRGTLELLVTHGAPWAETSGPAGVPERRYIAEDFPCPDTTPSLGPDRPDPGCAEAPFAVVVPSAAETAQELRAIGLRLEAWRAENAFVRRILGLERLLDGRDPETPAALLGLPFPPWTERVALVLVAPSAVPADAGEALLRALNGLRLAMVVCPAYYTHTRR
jgi:hypothetical protein